MSVALLALVAVAGSAAAQNPYFSLPADGRFVRAQPLALAEAKSACLHLSPPHFEPQRCGVVAFRELGQLGGVRLFAGWYRSVSDDEATQIRFIDFVLFESGSQGEVRPLWTYTYDTYPHYGDGVVGPLGIVDARLRRTSHGSFVELQFTSTGSAGDWTEYLMRRKGGWLAIERLHPDALQRCLPPDFEFWHGDELDIAQRTGGKPTRALGPEQTQGIVRYEFRIEGSQMRLVRCRHAVESNGAGKS